MSGGECRGSVGRAVCRTIVPIVFSHLQNNWDNCSTFSRRYLSVPLRTKRTGIIQLTAESRERRVLTPRNRDFQPRGIGTFSGIDPEESGLSARWTPIDRDFQRDQWNWGFRIADWGLRTADWGRGFRQKETEGTKLFRQEYCGAVDNSTWGLGLGESDARYEMRDSGDGIEQEAAAGAS